MNLDEFLAYVPRRRTAALFGQPLGHSLSPQIHKALTDTELDYLLVEVSAEELPRAVEHARVVLSGFNVTIPHKVNILPLLDAIGADARALGAVNTVINRDGVLTGANTDFNGLQLVLAREKLEDARALVVGAGGLGRTMAYLLREKGARVTVAARKPGQARELAEPLGCYHTTIDALGSGWELILNATPVGMFPHEGISPVKPDVLRGARFVYDGIYNPLETQLLRDAASLAVPAESGLSLLVEQAAEAQMLWWDTVVPKVRREEAYWGAMRTLARDRLPTGADNIVLTGFMGVGKSTVGRLLASRLGYAFLDTDSWIEEHAGMTVADIFATQGEEAFRARERRLAQELRGYRRTVVATGGGMPLNPDVYEALSKVGQVFWLDVPFEVCQARVGNMRDRPLWTSEDTERLTALYATRQSGYLAHSQHRVEAVGQPEEIVKRIMITLGGVQTKSETAAQGE